MSSPYPVLGNRPINQWKVTELKEELKRRKLVTKGLKEDLIKRLDEAIRTEQERDDLDKDNCFDSALQFGDLSEQEQAEACITGKGQSNINISDTEESKEKEQERDDLDKDNGFDSALQFGALSEQEQIEAYVSGKGQNNINISDTEESKEDIQPPVTYEQERSNLFVSESSKDAINLDDLSNNNVDGNILNVDINDTRGSIGEGKVREGDVVDCTYSAGSEGKQAAQVTAKETSDLVTENLEHAIALSGEDLQNSIVQSKSGDLKAQPENDDSKSVHLDPKDRTSDPNNQVSEVNPVLGFQVNSDCISTESVSINEKNELKDNVIADNVKLELDVKPEMVQPSSSSFVPGDGKSHLMDVEEPHANKVSVEETGNNTAENVDIVQKNETGDMGSSEKLNLDRSSGDDLMEEDLMENKPVESKNDSDEMGVEAEKIEARIVKDGDVPAKKVGNVEDKNGPAAPSMKRKLNDQQAVGNNDTAKRQRRWNSEGLKVPEPLTGDVVSTMPKDAFQPAFKRSFSRSDSTVSEEVPKERVVPPSPKPPTNSLRIDHFLRPFTLKAVQELLGKTGTITNFWMDNIKTHCYVSYSAVEEAVETRNAVYNLQWPPNGGRLLVADFVDPQEVKARVETTPQSPATPGKLGPSIPPVVQNAQPQPSPRQQVQKQQLPQPPLPPPPPQLSNPPPTARDHLPTLKERLTLPPPPPPPLTEKADPPIVTLDDLFRKTKATPRIYYLPLSDEQVAAKLQAQGKNVKQYAGLACRMFSLRWFWRSWCDDGFMFFQGVYWVEAKLILDFAMPKLGLGFLIKRSPFWGCSVKGQNPFSDSLFEPELLESNVLMDNGNVWSSFRFELAYSSCNRNLKMVVLILFIYVFRACLIKLKFELLMLKSEK